MERARPLLTWTSGLDLRFFLSWEGISLSEKLRSCVRVTIGERVEARFIERDHKSNQWRKAVTRSGFGGGEEVKSTPHLLPESSWRAEPEWSPLLSAAQTPALDRKWQYRHRHAHRRGGGAFWTQHRGQTRWKKKRGEEKKETVSMKNKTNHTTGCKSRKNKATTKQNFKIKDACKSWVWGTHAAEDHGKASQDCSRWLPRPAFPPICNTLVRFREENGRGKGQLEPNTLFKLWKT